MVNNLILQRVVMGASGQVSGLPDGSSSGFNATREGTGGSSGSDIANYTVEDYDLNDEFNTTTGVWSPTITAKFLIYHQGKATGNGEDASVAFERNLLLDSSAILEPGKTYQTVRSHTQTCPVIATVKVTDGDTYKIQQTTHITDTVLFGACFLTSSSGFTATKTTASGAAGEVISGWTETFDDGNCFDASTGVFTAPSSGKYLVSFSGYANTSQLSLYEMRLLKNGSVEGYRNYAAHAVWGGRFAPGCASVLDLAASDTLSIRQNTVIFGNCVFSVNKLDDVTEVFSARKVTATGSVNTQITGWTEDFDTNNNFDETTGVYTVPSTGRYLVMFNGHNDGVINGGAAITPHINSVNVTRFRAWTSTVNTNHTLQHSGMFSYTFTAGDTIELTQTTDLMDDCYFSVLKIA